jgi:hypothetical protein
MTATAPETYMATLKRDADRSAERLRTICPSNLFYWYSDEPNKDSRVIAHQYVAEHDPTPIDAAMLPALGFTETEPGLFYHEHGIVVSEYDGVFMATGLPSMDNKLIPTQAGELRRLLSLLDDITNRNSKGK